MRRAAFYFDRDHGSEIFCALWAGSYSTLGAAYESGFNPLQLPDTASNRAFLSEWLKSLLTAFGETFTNDDMARVTEAVSGNYKLSLDHRTLAHLAPFLGMEGRVAWRAGSVSGTARALKPASLAG